MCVQPHNLCLSNVIFTTIYRILPSGNDLQQPEAKAGNGTLWTKAARLLRVAGLLEPLLEP